MTLARTRSSARTLLIDTDIFIYKALFASEETHDWGDGNFSLTCNFDKAATLFRSRIAELEELCRADALLCMSSDTNFRKALWPEYKATRSSKRKPINLNDLKELVINEYETSVRPGLEADDIMGILATHPSAVPGKKLIVTIDKDLMQIPGKHLNPDKMDEGVITVTPDGGDHCHLMQTLTGDQVDNYPGIPGIGPKRADKILQEDTWEEVVAAYAKAELTEDDALTQARVARICRADDYNSDTQEVILWSPKT